MDNLEQKKGAMEFADTFAESLSVALATMTGSPWPLKVIDTGEIPANEATPIQFRLAVEGALRGECFVEFYEPQVATLLGRMTRQRVPALTEDHKAAFAKFLSSAAQGISTSRLARHGSFDLRIERVTGLAFGGMYVVPITASEGEPELQVLLYFGGELLQALLAEPGQGLAGEAGEGGVSPHNLKLVMDVELNVSLRFGQRQMPLREVLDLASGSVIELDRLVDEPVELFLDGKLIARGEAVVVDGNYGLRVTEIPKPIAAHLLN